MPSDPGFSSRPIYEGEKTSFFRRRRESVRLKGWLGGAVNLFLGSLSRLRRWWRKPRNRRQWRFLILKSVGGLLVLVILFLAVLWFTLPDINDPTALLASQSTVILDRNGVELYRLFSDQDRTYVYGNQINNRIKQATIAIEDERFLARSGCFDVIGFSRAVLSQIAPRFFVRSGGSTLTQQFAGNALVGRQRSIVRKLRELMLACQLERRYNKDQLLEPYLNWIPYGSNAYGIEQASRNYFGIGSKNVSLAQAAVLASLPQRPSYFTPYGPHLKTAVSDKIRKKIANGEITSASQIPNDDITIGLTGQDFGSGGTVIYVGGRTDQVLKNMLDQKMITAEDQVQALADLQKITFSPERQNIRAPHFVLDVQKQVEDMLGIDDQLLEQGGLRITTTLDWNLQQAAEKAVTAHLADIKKRFGAYNAALISVAPVTHEILAYVGNADFNDDTHEGKIDMAKSPRQPGSSFKAFTYASAFEQGYGPGTIMFDVPTKFGEDQPQNYDGTFWGLTDMRHALAGSRNVPAVKTFFLGGGEEPLLSLAARMGVPTPLNQKMEIRKQNPDFDYGWPLAIGTAEVPLTEMVQGYSTIADGGNFSPLKNILKITDKAGNILYLPKNDPPHQVIDERIAGQITSILSDIGARPNNDYWKSILSIPDFAAAAKTGTSNKCLERDSAKACTLRRPESTWTIGYTPNLITGVWVGNATSQSLFEKADGLTTAAPIWHDYMVEAHRKLKNAKTAFDLPPRLTHPLISRLSGQLASACTPVNLRSSDLFLQERTPTTEDPACVLLKVDKLTGLLSSPACPADAAEEQPFFIPKSELPDRWPLWQQGVQEWAAKQMELWNATPDHSGSLLPLPLPPTKECDPTLTPGRLNKPGVRIISPTAGASLTFPVFTPQIEITSVGPVKEVVFSIDGKRVADFTTEPFMGPVRVPRSISLNGTHTLSVTLTDNYFNSVSDTVTIRFSADAGLPQVNLLQPTDGDVFSVGSTLTAKAQASDSGGVEWVQFFLDLTLLTTKRSPPYEVSYPLNVEPGKHTVKVTARDNTGNESEDIANITVKPPQTGGLKSPASGLGD
jgi:membrane peptidoglycan carboxypeptidase